MKELSGGEIIVEQLIDKKVPYFFGLCGHGIVGFMDAALDRQDRVGTVSVHNEQIAGFAADAYYRITRQPCATFTSCGPGSVNIQMAVANAFFDSSAMFVITGNVPTQQFNRGPFQELGQHYQADFPSAMRPYVKRSYQATRAEMLPHMVRHAYSTMLNGRAGPVHLDVPFNVFSETSAQSLEVGEGWRSDIIPEFTADDAAAGRALDMLLDGERPLILCGNGALQSQCTVELAELAGLIQVPVATTPQGKGLLPETEPLYLGPTGRDGVYAANRAARASDVILAIGTRFGDRSTSSWREGVTHSMPSTRLIHADIDPNRIGQNYPAELGLVAEAKSLLRQLIRLARARTELNFARRSAWVDKAQAWRRNWENDIKVPEDNQTPMHPAHVVAGLAKAIPQDAVVLSDIGAHHSWMVQQWPIRQGGHFLQSGGSATMGFGVGGAIGAQLARPDSPTIAVVGDGGMLMHASAIATAVEYQLPIVWIVWNNCGYVSIRDLQKGFLGREFKTRFRNEKSGELQSVDFAALAVSMGAQGQRVGRAADLPAAVEAAIRSGKPTVLDVQVAADAGRLTAASWDMTPILGPEPNYDPDPYQR
ncbi:MAG: thiamine pyrophosphate-binding protein [Pusillimonas sp.]